MRKKTILSAAVCLALNALACWSAFHRPDGVTALISGLWLLSLVTVFVLLCRQTGDWAFRLPAFMLMTAYVAFLAYGVWDFMTHID